jgi:hypothetical protein
MRWDSTFRQTKSWSAGPELFAHGNAQNGQLTLMLTVPSLPACHPSGESAGNNARKNIQLQPATNTWSVLMIAVAAGTSVEPQART